MMTPLHNAGGPFQGPLHLVPATFSVGSNPRLFGVCPFGAIGLRPARAALQSPWLLAGECPTVFMPESTKVGAARCVLWFLLPKDHPNAGGDS